MPVSKVKSGKTNKTTAKVEDEDLEEEEEIETEPEEEEEIGEEGEEEGEGAPSAGKRGRGRPKGGSAAPEFPWNDNLDVVLIQTMEGIQSGKIKGSLTPDAVLSHLKDHEDFENLSHLLTPAAITTEIKKIAKALPDLEIPQFSARRKINADRLRALLTARQADDEESED